MSNCFIPGCKSGYKSRQRAENKKLGKKNLSLFTVKLKDEDTLRKWNRVIPRTCKTFTYKDKICELHFEDTDIIRYDKYHFPDGTSQILFRKFPALKPGAVPKFFPTCPGWFTKVEKNPSKCTLSKNSQKMHPDVEQVESQVPEESPKKLEIDAESLPRSIFSGKNPKSTNLDSLRQDLELTYEGSEFETDIFLLNYLQHPCLWNKSHPNYKVVEERRFAEKCLLECCGLPSLQMLQEKINHIHTEYNKELHRMKMALQKKILYSPKLQWFQFVHELLGSSLEELSPSSIEIEIENSSFEIVDDIVLAEVDELIKTYESTSEHNRTVMTQTDFETFKVHSFVGGQEISDEFAMFGQHVASQLSKLSLNEAAGLQENIQKLILEARLRETEANPSPGKEELDSVLDNYNAYLLFNKVRQSVCDYDS